MSGDTAKGVCSGQPQAHLPSINSLEFIHSLLDNLISRPKEQVTGLRLHLSQILLFFWCPKELKDERRLLYLEILPELQLTCLSYGAEVTVVDPFEWSDRSVAVQPDVLNLFLRELSHCRHFSGGPFFVAIVCEQCNIFVLPSVLAEEVVTQFSSHFSQKQGQCVFDDLYERAQDAVGHGCYKLKTFDSIGRKGIENYALLCERLTACLETEPDGPWLSKIFPCLYELLISYASEQEKQFSQRSLVVCKKNVAATQLANLHQNEESPRERLSPLGGPRNSGLSACDVEILMAPLSHDQTLNDSTLSATTKQSSLDTYLRRFYYRVSAKLKCKIQAALDLRHSESDIHQLLLSFKEDSTVHCDYALNKQRDILLGLADLAGQVKTAFENVSAGQRSIVLLKGSHGQGKTALLCHIAEVVSAWMDVGYVIVRFTRLTPLASTIHELLLGCCLELCRQFQLKMDLAKLASKYNTQQIFDWLEACCDQVAYKTCGKPVVLLVDDIHRLKETSSVSESKQSFWLPPRLPPNMVFLATVSDEVILEEGTYPEVVTRDYIFPIPPLSAEDYGVLFERLKHEARDSADLASAENYVGDLRSCPLAVQMLAEMPQVVKWLSNDHLDEKSILTKLTAIVDARLRMAEQQCGPSTCRFALSYIECARFGLTLGELLDLLTCCEPAMREVASTLGSDQQIYQFPFHVWLKLKQCLGCLLEEVVCDGRSVYKWSHLFVVGLVRRRYLRTVQQLKDCHMSLVALFNNTLSSAGIMESSMTNVKLRTVMPRPLVSPGNDGSPNFNLRRIRSLWYHLLHTGSVEYLQSQSLCNFEYLYASIRSAGIFHLKVMFESAMLQLLSHNFHVLYSSILRPSAGILCQDGNLLAAEVILALHYTRNSNTDVLNSLLEQAMSWVDSSSGIPLLVPLASWTKPKMSTLVVSCRFEEPRSADSSVGALVLEPTLNHQHVLVSGGGHGFSIWMYHISSRKKVRAFDGHRSSVVYLKTIADGQLFLSCATDGTVMIWSWTQVNCQRSFHAGKGKLLSACVAHSEKFLLTGFAECQIVLTPLFSEASELEKKVRTFSHHTGPVTALALTSQDIYLLSGSADFTVVISSMQTGLPISTLSGLMAPVKALSVTSNDAFAVLSCEDESLKVFSICMNSQLLELSGHDGKVCSLVIGKDDCHVFAGSTDGKVYCFDLHTGELISTQTCHQSGVSCLKLSTDGLFLLSGSTDAFNVWSTYANDVEDANEANYACVATISPDYKYAAYGNNGGRVILWDLEDCHDIWMTPSTNGPRITSLQFDYDSVILLSGSADGIVRILSMANGMTLKTFEGHSHPVTSIRIFSDRSVVISLDSFGHIILWSTEDTEDCSYEAFSLSDVGSLLEFLDDCDVLVTVKDNEKEKATREFKNLGASEPAVDGMDTSRHRLKVLNMVGREEAWITKARLQHNDDITCMCVSANQEVLVTGSKDMSLKLWSIKLACLTQVMAEHQEPVKHCAVNVDGSMVVSASTNEVLSWNVCSGQKLSSFEAHKGFISSLVVSEDGKVALSSDGDGWLYAWHTVDGSSIACFNAHLPVTSILISPDCRRILLTLKECPHIACLCLHNVPFFEDIVSDAFSPHTDGASSLSISERALVAPSLNGGGAPHNVNATQVAKKRSSSSIEGASRDAPRRRSRPGTASSTFRRSRSSLRLFDKLKRNRSQFFNVSSSVKSSCRGELIPTAMLASQSVCGAVTTSHSSGNDKAIIKPPPQHRTRVCSLL